MTAAGLHITPFQAPSNAVAVNQHINTQKNVVVMSYSA